MRFRFGEYEFDSATGELRRADRGEAGAAQRLPPQPARLLALLAERRGGLVARDEIRERLWPDTHVEFDASLHFCIRQIREALGDSAASPRYLETVPRRGYRLIPAVTDLRQGPVEHPAPPGQRRRKRPLLIAAMILVSLIVGVYAVVERAGWRGHRTTPGVRIAIMPFEPPAGMEGAGNWRPVAEWILEDLTAAAGKAAGIVGPTTTGAYDGSPEGLRRLAADYGVEYIINGRFLGSEAGPRVLVELIRVSDGVHVWVRGYDDPGDARRLGREISRNIALELRLPAGEPGAPDAGR